MKSLVQRVKDKNTRFMTHAINNLQSLLGFRESVLENYLGEYKNILNTVLSIVRVSKTPYEAYERIRRSLLRRRSKEHFNESLIVLGSLFCVSKEIILRLARELGIKEEEVIKVILCGNDCVCNDTIRKLYIVMVEHYPLLCGGWNRLKYLANLSVGHPIWTNLLILASRGSISAKLGNLLEKLLIEVLIKEGIPKERIESEIKKIKVIDPRSKNIYEFVSPRKIDIIVKDKQGIPRILGMISYQMTTSSGQTAKGLAEQKIVNLKKKLIEMFGEPVCLVCFVDGIGWIDRGDSDIERNISHCDDVFTFKIDEIKRFADLVRSICI